MRETESFRWPRLGLLAAMTLAWLVLAGLPGCGSTPPSDDMVTESDEPEIRRRARIRLQLAVGYFQQGKTTVALDEVKQSLNIDPEFADAYNLRGLIYMQLNDSRLAEDSFRRALALKPGDSNVLHNVGWMQCQRGQYREAVDSFTRALANPTYGDRAKTWLTKGLCQIKLGQLAEAEHSLNRSYELDAGNPVTGYNLALLLYQRGQYARAQFYISRINSGNLANAESLWLGARVEHRLGNRGGRDRLGAQLRNDYPQSRESNQFQRGAFNER